MISAPPTRLVASVTAPEPGESGDRPAAGDDGDDRHQEVLGEQLAARQQQRHEADREGQSREQGVAGVLLDDEEGQHAEADVDAAEKARSRRAPATAAPAAPRPRRPAGRRPPRPRARDVRVRSPRSDSSPVSQAPAHADGVQSRSTRATSCRDLAHPVDDLGAVADDRPADLDADADPVGAAEGGPRDPDPGLLLGVVEPHLVRGLDRLAPRLRREALGVQQDVVGALEEAADEAPARDPCRPGRCRCRRRRSAPVRWSRRRLLCGGVTRTLYGPWLMCTARRSTPWWTSAGSSTLALSGGGGAGEADGEHRGRGGGDRGGGEGSGAHGVLALWSGALRSGALRDRVGWAYYQDAWRARRVASAIWSVFVQLVA